MHPFSLPVKSKKSSPALNIQCRAAIAEKHVAVKKAAMLRTHKQTQQPTTPDHEHPVTTLDSVIHSKHVLLPSIVRAQHAGVILKHLSLELNAELSFPTMKGTGQKSFQKIVSVNSKARKCYNRGALPQDSGMQRSCVPHSSETSQQAPKSKIGGCLHWKSSSGNVVTVDKPVFLTETDERVSPSKNVFQNTLIKSREKNVIKTVQTDAESLIATASRLCLASHSTSHRTSDFWFDATIALAGMSQDSLDPVLKYFNQSLSVDIKSGHVIAALIKALNDLSDAYQQFLFSWVEEQQYLFVNARISSQTGHFDSSLKTNYEHIEKLCFVANEVIAFLEEPGIPEHAKFEQIERDKKDLRDMLTFAHEFDASDPQSVLADFQEQSESVLKSKQTSKFVALDHKSACDVDLGEESQTEDDDCDQNIASVSYVQQVMEINVSTSCSASKVSIVVAAARKYLNMKVEMRNNVVFGRPAQGILPNRDETDLIPSRIAYLHTCEALKVTPVPEIFLSITNDKIDLRHYHLGVRGCIALSAGCCKFFVLSSLDLQNCMLTVAGCLLLSEAVSYCSKLQYLNIGSCIPTSESGNCEEFGTAISNFSKSSLSLSELNLSNNSIIGIPIIRWDSLQSDVNQNLSKLDLSNCMLGSAACNPLSRVIDKLVGLKYLNIRWNKFNGDAVCNLVHVLSNHSHIFELDMSWNSCINNKSSAAIQTLLFQNASLSSLNLSFCNMKPIHATIISAGYMANQTLRKFFVEGNPLGQQGSLALLKVSSSEYNEEVRMLSLAGCNLDYEDDDAELFDFLQPSCDNKNFDLMYDYDWACAFLLCAIRCECDSEIFTKSFLNEGSWSIPGKLCDKHLWFIDSNSPEAEKEKLIYRTKHVEEQRRFIFERIPKTGVLTLSVVYSNPPKLMSAMVFANNLKMLSRTTQEDGALASKKFVKLAMNSMSTSLMTSKQAKEMLEKIDDDSAKAEFIANMIEKIVDKDDFIPEIDKLPFDISKKLKVDLKDVLAFDSRNATGRYSFDLERFADRVIMKKLMEVNDREKIFRKQLQLGNTSCLADWDNFRNFTLNGHEMRFTASWQLPKKGNISCDYTSVIRPSQSAKPIHRKCLENWLEGLSKFVSVCSYCREEPVTIPEVCDTFTSQNLEIIHEGISWLSNRFYFTCTQLEIVLHSFLMAGPLIMTHVVQRLFARVLDLGKFRKVILKYFSTENYIEVMNRIGWLNAANPFEVDGYYLLDLAVPEQREVAIVLVDLAVQEPGENWQDEEYDGRPFELPSSWTIEVPHKKVLSLKYFTGPNCALQHVRSKWSKNFLLDSSMTEEFYDLANDEQGDGHSTVFCFRPHAEVNQIAEGAAPVAHTSFNSA